MYLTEVPTSELEALKKQAEAIQKRISELTAPTSIATASKKKPYLIPAFKDNKCTNPVVFRDFYDSDAWQHFLALGKMVHTKNGVFVERNRRSPWPYTVDERNAFVPKKVSDLTREEVRTSAEMIDRMVEIYNEYMVKLHTDVTFVDAFGQTHIIPVSHPLQGVDE